MPASVRSGAATGSSRRAAGVAAGALPVLLVALALALPRAMPVGAQTGLDPYAGTYRLADWAALEADGIRHEFRLMADGRFVLTAEWRGRERSRFTGTWSAGEGALQLSGTGAVQTNQGSWETPFSRSYRIGTTEQGKVMLTPIPEKNRYGLLGWPNAFVRFAEGE